MYKGTSYHEDLIEGWWGESSSGNKIPGTPYCILEILDNMTQTIDVFIVLRYYEHIIRKDEDKDSLNEIILPKQEEINTFIAFISSKGIGISNTFGYPVSKYSQWFMATVA